MAVRTVNKDGSVTVTTEDEDAGPTGAVKPLTDVTTTFDTTEKVVAKSESKTVKKSTSK